MASSCRRRISGVPGQLPLVMEEWADGGCVSGSSLLASTSGLKMRCLHQIIIKLRTKVRWVKFHFFFDPAILLLGMYPRELKTYAHVKTCTQMFKESRVIIAPKWKQLKCPSTDAWIKYGIATRWNMTRH